MNNTLHTIDAWLAHATKQLLGSKVDSARLDALLLLENELKVAREWVLAHNDELLSEDIIDKLNKKLSQRLQHTPLAYIIGSKEFYGREFKVTDAVLIPRPESEDMINLLLQHSRINLDSSGKAKMARGIHDQLDSLVRLEKDKPVTVLDIGTGSGILAITAQREIPDAIVVGTDISLQALGVAEENAKILQARVQFYEANLLDLPAAIKPDIILANLPYVPNNLITSEEITKEPALALFSGDDGLDLYRTFWQQLINYSPRPLYIITESLTDQHNHMVMLAQAAHYKVEMTKGLAQLYKISSS